MRWSINPECSFTENKADRVVHFSSSTYALGQLIILRELLKNYVLSLSIFFFLAIGVFEPHGVCWQLIKSFLTVSKKDKGGGKQEQL